MDRLISKSTLPSTFDNMGWTTWIGLDWTRMEIIMNIGPKILESTEKESLFLALSGGS